MSLITFKQMVGEAARYLEQNRRCSKHHVEHTGSNAYLLDLYGYLGAIEQGKSLLWYLLGLVRTSPEGAQVFYPGHLNPMNMSQNVIDTGAAVDAIARFASTRSEAFSYEEHSRIRHSLDAVVETYLASAACDKQITNQRLWGLTGLASYAQYRGEEERYRPIARKSIDRAYADMTVDGFFRYYPNPPHTSAPYDAMSAFYQSRHIAFIDYTLRTLAIDDAPYQASRAKSIAALLSMYTTQGWKDMRMECKRWYWFSPYEVASHAFDAYALALSDGIPARAALCNVLFQIRSHFFDGYLHSHRGTNNNFQCPIFWTAHLAWLTRLEGIAALFDETQALTSFVYRFEGKEVFSDTNQNRRILIHTSFGPRNPTAGIVENGLSDTAVYVGPVPRIPHAYLFSVRESLNHAWYALRGAHIGECARRVIHIVVESVRMFLPLYRIAHGRIESLRIKDGQITVTIVPASKYGTISNHSETCTIPL